MNQKNSTQQKAHLRFFCLLYSPNNVTFHHIFSSPFPLSLTSCSPMGAPTVPNKDNFSHIVSSSTTLTSWCFQHYKQKLRNTLFQTSQTKKATQRTTKSDHILRKMTKKEKFIKKEIQMIAYLNAFASHSLSSSTSSSEELCSNGVLFMVDNHRLL